MRVPTIRRVLYMAHPLNGDVHENILRAKRWLRWFHEASEYADAAVIAPWLLDRAVIPVAMDDLAENELALRKCEATAARCDGVVLVGGRISSGMEAEAQAARAAGRRVISLIHLGAEPPELP